MTPEDSQTEAEKVVLAPFDLLEGTSESARAKTVETLGSAGAQSKYAKRLSGGMALILGFLFGASART
jgi:hypothetical protein